jgi:hypothetical protein
MNFLTAITSSFLWRKAAQTSVVSVYTFAKNAIAHFSQYYELSNGCYEQLSLAESCANFCGFGLHLCENATAHFPDYGVLVRGNDVQLF